MGVKLIKLISAEVLTYYKDKAHLGPCCIRLAMREASSKGYCSAHAELQAVPKPEPGWSTGKLTQSPAEAEGSLPQDM